jgi:hypothetical protein
MRQGLLIVLIICIILEILNMFKIFDLNIWLDFKYRAIFYAISMIMIYFILRREYTN